MAVWNIFRILGDLSHILSKLVLLWSIHWNKSSEGVSLITQALYILVFLTRYLDIFSFPIFAYFANFYLFVVKAFYIASSAYIVFLMTFAYARTREREQSWRIGIYSLVGAAALAIPMCKMFEQGPVVGNTSGGLVRHLYSHEFKFTEVLRVFSEALESVAVLPQLILLRQTSVSTVIDSYYLTLLGSYRALYILNWIVRLADRKERHFDPIAVLFGTIQTILYIDFAWVYYSRQRVKLRAGGIVDAADMERGFFIGRIASNKFVDGGNDDNAGHSDSAGNAEAGSWGTRGISVSADDERPLASPSSFEDLSDDNSDQASLQNTTPKLPTSSGI